MKSHELVKDKLSCCSCACCVDVCPKRAITMKPDEYSFLYPQINEELCVNCGLCKKKCAYQNIISAEKPKEVYAAVTIENEILNKSASGGVFASVARKFIEDGGIVFGAAFEHIDDFVVKHIEVSNITDLQKLQGSKYVISNTEGIFLRIKKLLNESKKVLFSGTPCQVASLKEYIGQSEALTTIDIICHGVPSMKMLSDYLIEKEKKLQGKIVDFIFRDKTFGNGYRINAIYEKQGKIQNQLEMVHTSSYYRYFLTSEIFRENCYSCKYANTKRYSDLTIGDYWGIEKALPDEVEKGLFSENKGVSCILVNTNKGNELLRNYGQLLYLSKSIFELVSKGNKQLIKPSTHSKLRDDIMNEYKLYGYKGIERLFRRRLGIKYYYLKLKFLLLKR